MSAACQLVSEAGGRVVSCMVIMELPELKGRDKVEAPVTALIDL